MIKQLKMLGEKIPDCSEDLREKSTQEMSLVPFLLVKGTHSDDFKMH